MQSDEPFEYQLNYLPYRSRHNAKSGTGQKRTGILSKDSAFNTNRRQENIVREQLIKQNGGLAFSPISRELRSLLSQTTTNVNMNSKLSSKSAYDPQKTLPEDAYRARSRGIVIKPQQPNLMPSANPESIYLKPSEQMSNKTNREQVIGFLQPPSVQQTQKVSELDWKSEISNHKEQPGLYTQCIQEQKFKTHEKIQEVSKGQQDESIDARVHGDSIHRDNFAVQDVSSETISDIQVKIRHENVTQGKHFDFTIESEDIIVESQQSEGQQTRKDPPSGFQPVSNIKSPRESGFETKNSDLKIRIRGLTQPVNIYLPANVQQIETAAKKRSKAKLSNTCKSFKSFSSRGSARISSSNYSTKQITAKALKNFQRSMTRFRTKIN